MAGDLVRLEDEVIDDGVVDLGAALTSLVLLGNGRLLVTDF
jgi:hypothetical protein